MSNNEHNNLTPKEIYELKKHEKQKQKQAQKTKETLQKAPKNILKKAIMPGIVIVIVLGIGYLISITPNLPANSSAGHTEESPESHILTTPMPERVQKHMMEHADGKGRPGILMQYNCTDYECEDDFVAKLEAIVKEYPEHVYLAPNTYDGKLILTAEGRREILDEYDEEKIRAFIGE